MVAVPTVGGEVDSAELGVTYCHEHVFVLSPDVLTNQPELWDREERVADARTKLQGLVEDGVGTVLDPTVVGLGRDVALVQEVLEGVDGLNVVAATGLYTYDSVPHHYQYVGPGTLLGGDDPMVELFVRDLTEGIAETGVRAAFLKCAVDAPGMTDGVRRVMDAVAAAHEQTGAPVTVHTHVHNESGLAAQQHLRERGVDPSRVVLGHSGDSTDLGYLKNLADAGSYLGMDRFGVDVLLPFEQRVDVVAQLCADGYAERMVLAHDASCFIDWIPQEAMEQAVPNWHFRHLARDVLPALRERGVSDEQITTMLVDNPRRYLETAAA